MQEVSETYKRLFLEANKYYENMVKINGVEYRENTLVAMKTTASVFPGESIALGGCVARKIKLSILKPSVAIPKMAKIEPFVRLSNGIEFSEWIPKGKFYIDTRKEDRVDPETDGLIINGYCDMLKAEADCPVDGLDWPARDIDVVRMIAADMGVQIDQRTIDIMVNGYSIEIPADYSEREVLSAIASMYGGAFIMSDAGQLLLVQLSGIPEETNYLILNNGEPLTFGGVRILV